MSTVGIRTKPEPYCPDCGARMVLQKPNPNQPWSAFWGCNRYPICRVTRQIDPETGEPETDGEWEERGAQ